VLQQGASQLLAEAKKTDKVIDLAYQRGLGREPTSSEKTLCQSLLGKTPTVSGVEDLLWAVVMLPEFQLLD
jgi:hypothetical protein